MNKESCKLQACKMGSCKMQRYLIHYRNQCVVFRISEMIECGKREPCAILGDAQLRLILKPEIVWRSPCGVWGAGLNGKTRDVSATSRSN